MNLLKPMHLEPVLHGKRNHCSEKPVHCNEEQPLLTTAREGMHSNEDPVQPKNISEKIMKTATMLMSTTVVKLYIYIYINIIYIYLIYQLVAQLVKNQPAMQETWVLSLGWEDPLEKGMATYSSILAWRILWTV